MCCNHTSTSLSRLGMTVGLLSLITLLTAFVSNVWVYTREPVNLPGTHITTYITYKIGFWRACPHLKKLNFSGYRPSPACQLIRYNPWGEIHGRDLGVVWAPLEFTPTFVTKMRWSMPLSALSLLMLIAASLYALTGHCSSDYKTLVACALFVLAGLSLASGLVVFVSVLSDAHTNQPSSQPSHFHYHYGWSFFTAGAAFILAEVAALLSVTSYIRRFPSVEAMVRVVVPGADRVLQEHRISSQFLVKHSNTTSTPDMIQKMIRVEESDSGYNKTPPDICPLVQSCFSTPVTVPIALIQDKPSPNPRPPPSLDRYVTLPRYRELLEVSEGITSSSSSTSSSRPCTSSLARQENHLLDYRRGSLPRESHSFFYGQQPIVILSDEEIV